MNNHTTISGYINAVSVDKKAAVEKLHQTVAKNLPKGFIPEISYGMIGYVVPHTLYPNGYHCDPKLPLPFISIAAQKNFIALYHMGIYVDAHLLAWWKAEYPKYCKTKLDMGKSCIRFKKTDDIPYKLIAELCKKMSVNEWIQLYERMLNNKK